MPMATMNDVARRAGVSLSTVSYALSGVRPVSESTKQRIREAMEELDFSPNAVAQGLAGRRTRILALVLPTDETPVDPYTGEIIVGAADAARDAGYHLLLWTEPATRAPELKSLLNKGLIDGAIVLAIQLDDPRIATLEQAGLPLAMIGQTESVEGRPFVDTDAADVARRAIEHLVARGRTSFAYVASASADPAAGYGISNRLHDELRRVAAASAIDLVAVFEGRSAADVAPVVTRLVGDRPAIDAVLAFGDAVLGGCLTGLAGAGRRVPDDVSVVGLLCTDFAADLVHPRATTVSPLPTELGRQATTTMLRFLDEQRVDQTLLPATLAVRDST